MQTIIIIGSDIETKQHAVEKYLATWGISRFDRITPESDTPSIGIAQIRSFAKRLSLKPQQGTKVAGVIMEGEKLTVEAQQAMLKTLEEPPSHAYLIVCVPNTAHLLPTIISRCICNYLPQTPKESGSQKNSPRTQEILAVLDLPPGKRLHYLSTIGSTKDDLVAWIHETIHALRDEIISKNTPPPGVTRRYSYILHRLIDAQKYSENNINLGLYLEHIFLTLP